MKCCEVLEVRYKCKEEHSLEGKEVKNTIVITFAFQVVFTAFNALQNMHSSLHDEESLGNISLAIISGTAIVSSVLAPTIIGLIGAKPAIVAFFAAHCLYVLANFYPSFATMAPAAIALGLFNGPAWTSQALYISASAFSFSKSSAASPYSILSRFNGFFFAVYATSQILGNLVTSTVIKDGIENSTDVNYEFKYCGSDDCPSTQNATAIEDPEGWVLDIVLGIFMSCTLLGLFMVVFLLSPLPRSEWIERVSVHKSATSCFNVLVSTNMILLAPFILFTAMEQAFLLSAYTKSYIACPIGIHMVGYVMASYGATTPLLVFIVNRLAKVAGRFLLLTLSMAVQIILFTILFLWSPTSDDVLYIFLLPMAWGVSESVLLAQANSLIAMQFPNQKEPAFANFHACRSLGYTISFLNASYMCVSTKVIVCMTFAGVGLVLYVFVEFKTKVKEKRALEQPRRSSLASVESPVAMRPAAGRQNSVTSQRTSVSSLQSVQDRLSFDRVELTDIIMEAQHGWRRDEEGLTLEISKVMSQEHLSNSIVTNWYRTAPGSGDFADRIMPRPATSRPGLPRSLSDGQLHYAAVKVDAALDKMRHGRSNTIATGKRKQMPAAALPKRRHVSDINPPNLDVIREIVYEDELEIGNESVVKFYHFDSTDEHDNVFEQGDDEDDNNNSNDDDDDIDEEEAKRIMDYRDILRRLSSTLNKDNLAQKDNAEAEEEDDSLSNVSESSAAQDVKENENEPQRDGGNITFMIGTSSPSSSVRYNKAFESDDNENVFDDRSVVYHPGRQRVNSDSARDISSRHTNGTVVTSFHNGLKGNAASEHSPTKDKKTGVFSVLKGFRKSSKSNTEDKHNSNHISSDKPIGVDNEDNDHSDADSDGFVNYKYDDNDNYLTNDVSDVVKIKTKKRVPVSEWEDVNSIY